MTRNTRPLFLLVILLLMTSVPMLAATPSTAPNEGDMAVSFNLGFARSFDDHFDEFEPVFTGSIEYYTSARVSWRGMLGVASLDADVPGNGSVDTAFLTANVLYNWEQDRIHPYVTGGIGAYNKDASSNLPSKYDETAIGLNGGGGIDWYLGSRWALEFEGTLHGLVGENPDTIVIVTAGITFWF